MAIQNINFDQYKKIFIVLLVLIILIVAIVLGRHFWIHPSKNKQEIPTNPALYKDIEYKPRET